MKRLLVLVVASAGASAQPLSFGFKGGVPLADAVKIVDSSTYKSFKPPAVLGPALELRLPLGLGGETGLYYRRVEYASSASRTAAQAWEIPLLFKYRAGADHLHPFITAGLSTRWLARFRQRTYPTSGTPGLILPEEPAELRKRTTAGPTLGAGLEISLPIIRLSAELRYTRWGSMSLKAAAGGLLTQLNQADILLGLMF